MPENDFEKQVQQIFSDMKLKPSEVVWSKVQDRITQDKKRRRLIFWLPAAVLLLVGGGYWLLSGNDTSSGKVNQDIAIVTNTNNQKVTDPEADLPPGNDQTGTNDLSAPNGTIANQAITPSSQQAKAETSVGISKEDLKNELDEVASAKPANKKLFTAAPGSGTLKETTGRMVQNKRSKDQGDLKAASKEVLPSHDPEKQSWQEGTDALPNDETLHAIGINGYFQQVNPYDGLWEISAEKELKNFAGNGNKPVVKLGKRKTWEWGVSAQAGISNVGKGLSEVLKNGLFEKNSADYAYSSPASADLSFLGNQVNYLPAAAPPASPIKAGMAWNAGGFGKWHIKDRLAVNFGVEYSLYTTERLVGNVINNLQISGNLDANARYAGYYATANNGVINYTNRYHFVQAPIGIQWQLNKGIHLPLQLEAGVALAYLANTNAVNYRQQTGAYYEDKSLFHKFQTGLYAGFTAKLLQHTKRPLYVGPVVQYNLSKLTKPAAGKQEYFMYAGLKAQWVFWKK